LHIKIKQITKKIEIMKTINFLNTELAIYYTKALTAGHGHKKITVELYLLGEYKTFSATTSNMPDYDEATELEGSDKDEALFNIISMQIEDEVSEWISEIENK
jgi:hypothetical protein